MKTDRLTDAEIRALGWQALIDKLGPAGALRFALQTERGYGDYARSRHELLGALSVDDVLAKMRGARPLPRGRRRGR
jgi:hypothetical protein